jgi:hypothetical protein
VWILVPGNSLYHKSVAHGIVLASSLKSKSNRYVEKLSDHRLEKSNKKQDFFIHQYYRTNHRHNHMYDDFSVHYE